MPARHKLTICLIAFMAIFLFFPKDVFAQVVINEVLPNPPGDDATGEWVELYNLGVDTVDVAGYKLEDASGHTLVIDENYVDATTVIAGQQWLAVKRNSSSFSLNNSDIETISLYSTATESAQPVDSFSYTGSSEGKSWGRIPDGSDDVFEEKLEPTPGSANFVPSHSLSPSSTPSQSPSSAPDSSPTSSPTSSPSLTPSPEPVEVIGATFLGKILGEEKSSPAGFYPWEATEEAESQEATESSRTKFISKLFLGLGLVFLVSSGVWIWYTQLR